MAKTYKIAVLSDIHSNFVALKAVLDELDGMKIDDVVVAGDNIGLFVQPNQTVELLQKINARIIHGNSEDRLQSYNDGTTKHWADFHQMTPLVWTYGELTDNNLQFLLNIPEQITFSVEDTSIRVVHGSVRSVSELIYKHENQKIKEGLASAKEDILICGHSHQQWHKKVDDTLIVNPGSVGISFIKDGKAPFSILTYENGNWSVDEKQVAYDIQRVEDSFKKTNINNYSAWEKMLLHSLMDGKITTLAFLRYAKQYALSSGWDGNGGLIPNEHWQKANETFDWKNYDYQRGKGGF